MIIKRSVQELNRVANKRLEEHTPINSTHKGARAKLLLDIINRNVAQYYEDIEQNVLLAFVSRAEGKFLDLIGELVNCKRMPGESRENYRYRITQQVYTAAKVNKTAIELTCLTTDGVSDVYTKPYTHGTGSFTVYVIPENTDNSAQVVRRVKARLEKQKSYGTKVNVETPTLLPVSMRMRLVFGPETKPSIIGTAITDVRNNVKKLIDNLAMGDSLVIAQVIDKAMDDNKHIKDVQFEELVVNDIPRMITNYDPYWDEKLVVDSVSDIEII